MSFRAVQGSFDPKEFSWEVELAEGQELLLVDSQHAAVYYTKDHHTAFGITATPAHDASGATVPTSLAVSAGARCLVPRLEGRSLRNAAQRLRKANCKIGQISKRKGITARAGKVVKQSPEAGVVWTGRALVNVTLGE